MNLKQIFNRQENHKRYDDITHILQISCPDIMFPSIDKKTNKSIEALNSELISSFPLAVKYPTPIFIRSACCETSIRSRSDKHYIVLNLDDGQLLEFIFKTRSKKQFAIGALHWIKQAIAENYIYTNKLNLFALTLAYENIPPFILSQSLYSGPQEQFPKILKSYFRSVRKHQITTVSVCFDFLHEWGHFLLEQAPDRMIEFENIGQEQFVRSKSAFPTFDEVDTFAKETGWAENVTSQFYEKVIEEKKESSFSLFPTIKDEVTCDIFAVSMLVRFHDVIDISYGKLLKIIHAKVSCHHLRVAISHVSEQLDIFNALKNNKRFDDTRLEVFSGQVSDRAHVAGDFLLSFSMDSSDELLRENGAKYISEMRAFNQVTLEAYLFPTLQIIPIFIGFAIDKLRDEKYRESMEYFADRLSPADLAKFIREPSFI